MKTLTTSKTNTTAVHPEPSRLTSAAVDVERLSALLRRAENVCPPDFGAKVLRCFHLALRRPDLWPQMFDIVEQMVHRDEQRRRASHQRWLLRFRIDSKRKQGQFQPRRSTPRHSGRHRRHSHVQADDRGDPGGDDSDPEPHPTKPRRLGDVLLEGRWLV